MAFIGFDTLVRIAENKVKYTNKYIYVCVSLSAMKKDMA